MKKGTFHSKRPFTICRQKSLIGFTDAEITALEPSFEPGSEDDQGKLDELDPKWIACPHCGKEFDARQA